MRSRPSAGAIPRGTPDAPDAGCRLSRVVDRHRPCRRKAGAYGQRLRDGRSPPADGGRAGDGLRDVVRRGDRPRHLGHVSRGRVPRADLRPARRVALPCALRPDLRAAAVPDEADDAGRLLPHPLRQAHRARDLGLHRDLVPGLGRCAGDCPRSGLQRALRGRDLDERRHDDRRRRRAALHAVRRHVVGRGHHVRADDRDRHRPADRRLDGERHGRRLLQRHREGRGGGQVLVPADASTSPTCWAGSPPW